MTDLRKLKNRIDWFCDNKINAFSPTISPAPKSSLRNEIESIYEGVRYFCEVGVDEIVVQRKYMGSYCDIYLQKNLSDTYFVSRNGYRLFLGDAEKARAACSACADLHKRFDWTNLQTAIVQSEIMPWSALGKTLIDNDFGGYLNAHLNHHDYLTKSGLYAKIEEVKKTEQYHSYLEYKATHTAKEVREHFPAHIVRQYEALTGFRVLDLPEYRKNIDIYAIQLEHFGRDGEMYFKPFNILKKIFDDGSEQIVNDNMSYCDVNDDEFLHLSFADDDEMNRAVEKIYEWFANLEAKKEEGIVIKPRTAFIKNVPPAFKVRNNQYLVMIYGVDFKSNYAQYFERRKINKKIDCSINDWMLNWELLKVKYADINSENYLLKNLILDRIIGEQTEATLDSTL